MKIFYANIICEGNDDSIHIYRWSNQASYGLYRYTLESQASRRLSAIVGDENILCEHHLNPSANATPIRSIFTGGMVENCAHSIYISRKFEYMYVGDPSQTRRDPLEPVAEHFQLQPATRLYMGYIVICGPKVYMVFQPFLVVNGVSNMDYIWVIDQV